MDTNKAKELLSFHSARNGNIDSPKWKNGFLGSLRPFCGKLNKENFIEVMECLKTLKDDLNAPVIEHDIVCDIVGIIHVTRSWVSPDGMLGRNHLLTDEQTKRLLAWVDTIEECFMYLLEGDTETAFNAYEYYMSKDFF